MSTGAFLTGRKGMAEPGWGSLLSPRQRAPSQITRPVKSNPFLCSGNSCTASAEAGAGDRPWAWCWPGFPCRGRWEWGHRGCFRELRVFSQLAAYSRRHGRSQGGDAGRFPRDWKYMGDVGARAKQTSLFLKFIPSLASGHNWVISVVCISKFSCRHAHTQDAACQPVTTARFKTGCKAVPASSLSSFSPVTFSQLLDSFRKPPERWAGGACTKWSTRWECHAQRRVHRVLIFFYTAERQQKRICGNSQPLLSPVSISPHVKKFVIQLIPPSPRNSTDPLTPPPWSFKKSQQHISARVSVFHRSIWLLVCILSNRGEMRDGAKHKQRISSPGSVCNCSGSFANTPEQGKNTPAKGEGKPLCLQSSLVSCWGRCCAGDFYVVGSE